MVRDFDRLLVRFRKAGASNVSASLQQTRYTEDTIVHHDVFSRGVIRTQTCCLGSLSPLFLGSPLVPGGDDDDAVFLPTDEPLAMKADDDDGPQVEIKVTSGPDRPGGGAAQERPERGLDPGDEDARSRRMPPS